MLKGRPLSKHPRIDAEGYSHMMTRVAEKAKVFKREVGKLGKKKSKEMARPNKTKTISQALSKRIERFDLVTNIFQ